MPFIVGRARTSDQPFEERLVAQVSVVLLEVLFGRSDELDGGKLVADIMLTLVAIVNLRPRPIPSPLKAADDFADESALPFLVSPRRKTTIFFYNSSHLDAIWLHGDKAVSLVRLLLFHRFPKCRVTVILTFAQKS